MLIQKLVEYGGRAPTGVPSRYKATRVKYLIVLREDGTPIQMVELSDGNETGKKNRGKELIVPHVAKAAGIKANLLVDNAEYVLGIPRDPLKAEKTQIRHSTFREQLRECATETGEASVASIVRFYETEAGSRIQTPAEFDASANVTFEVRGMAGDVRPVDLPSIRAFWASRGESMEAEGAEQFECLVCGTSGPIERILELKLKRIPEGQATGTSLISFNAPAFTSFGLEQTQNAPICKACAEGFSQSLNGLIESPATSLRLGLVQYVFWTRAESGIDFGALLDGDEQAVRALYTAAQSGRFGATELDTNRFYSAALTANGGRAVLRDWIDSSLLGTVDALKNYFDAQRIVEWDGQDGTPLPMWRLANATIRTGAKNERPAASVAPALLRFALAGTPLPRSLMWDAVRRNRAEHSVRRERAALIKLTMRSRDRTKGARWMEALEPVNEDVAYRCGRLLAVIEQVQRAALGDVNATVVDRFYGTASTAPIAVFSRLLKGAQPHLAKLRRDRPGTFRALDRRLQDVLEPVKTFPSVLNLEQQGAFALGYYHQRADDRRAARERGAANKSGAADEAASDHTDA